MCIINENFDPYWIFDPENSTQASEISQQSNFDFNDVSHFLANQTIGWGINRAVHGLFNKFRDMYDKELVREALCFIENCKIENKRKEIETTIFDLAVILTARHSIYIKNGEPLRSFSYVLVGIWDSVTKSQNPIDTIGEQPFKYLQSALPPLIDKQLYVFLANCFGAINEITKSEFISLREKYKTTTVKRVFDIKAGSKHQLGSRTVFDVLL